jgi:hypothetical protein
VEQSFFRQHGLFCKGLLGWKVNEKKDVLQTQAKETIVLGKEVQCGKEQM